MKAAQSRQKAYADNRRRLLKFEGRDKVFPEGISNEGSDTRRQ